MKLTTFCKRALSVVLLAIATTGPLAADYFHGHGPSWIRETSGAGVENTALLLMILLLAIAGVLVCSSFDD